MKAHEICERAAEAVRGAREREYGNKRKSHQYTADQWNAYLGDQLLRPITARQVAIMMIEFKVSRTKLGTGNDDTYVDIAGYAGCAGEIAALEKEGPSVLDYDPPPMASNGSSPSPVMAMSMDERQRAAQPAEPDDRRS